MAGQSRIDPKSLCIQMPPRPRPYAGANDDSKIATMGLDNPRQQTGHPEQNKPPTQTSTPLTQHMQYLNDGLDASLEESEEVKGDEQMDDHESEPDEMEGKPPMHFFNEDCIHLFPLSVSLLLLFDLSLQLSQRAERPPNIVKPEDIDTFIVNVNCQHAQQMEVR